MMTIQNPFYEMPAMTLMADLLSGKSQNAFLNGEIDKFTDFSSYRDLLDVQSETMQAIRDAQGVMIEATRAMLTRHSNLAQEVISDVQRNIDQSKQQLNERQTPENLLAEEIEEGAQKLEKFVEDSNEYSNIAMRSSHEAGMVLANQFIKNIYFSAKLVRDFPSTNFNA